MICLKFSSAAQLALIGSLQGRAKLSAFKVIGIRRLGPVKNNVSLKLMQRKTLNFVINLPDVENITK